MVRMLILLERREELSHEEFLDYWREHHAPLVEEMPRVREYVIDVPRDPAAAGYDGVAELAFEDVDDVGAAFGSEAGQAVEADAEEFVAEQTTLLVDREVQFRRAE